MARNEVLKLTTSDVMKMPLDARERVAYQCRSLRGLIYDFRTNEEYKAWERHTGMTVQQAKDHTLALLDACENP